MDDGSQFRVMLVTAPVAVADALATSLVEERLAACVSIVPGVLSIYRWQDAVEREAEALLIAKTDTARLDALRARVSDLHPYDVPEILALPVAEGSRDYLAWLAASLRPLTD